MPRGGRRLGAGRPAVQVAPDNPDQSARVLERRVQAVIHRLNQLPLGHAINAITRFASNRIGQNAKDLLKVVLPEQSTEAEINEAAAITVRRLRKRNPRQLTREEALRCILHLNMSKFQYKELSKTLHLAAGFSIFPSYDHVRAEKAQCRPTEGVSIDEAGGSVGLMSLVLHTFKRILQIEDPVQEQRLQALQGNIKVTFVLSYGYDSSTSQRRYNQKFHNTVNIFLFVVQVDKHYPK